MKTCSRLLKSNAVINRVVHNIFYTAARTSVHFFPSCIALGFWATFSFRWLRLCSYLFMCPVCWPTVANWVIEHDPSFLCVFPLLTDQVIGSQLDRKENKLENWQDICFVSENNFSTVQSAFICILFFNVWIFLNPKFSFSCPPSSTIKGEYLNWPWKSYERFWIAVIFLLSWTAHAVL